MHNYPHSKFAPYNNSYGFYYICRVYTMKHLIAPIFILIILSGYAQEEEVLRKPPKPEENAEHTMLQIFYTGWLDAPDTISADWWSRGVNIYVMLDKAISKESNFKASIGLGIGSDNIMHDAQLVETTDSTRSTLLVVYPDTLDFNNKLSTTYLDVPVELRYRTKPNKKGRSFKVAAGFKAGVIINSHTKYSGQDPANPARRIKIKELKLRDISRFRYGVTGRIGYGSVSAFAYYGLTELFESNGPQLTPFAVGLIISVY